MSSVSIVLKMPPLALHLGDEDSAVPKRESVESYGSIEGSVRLRNRWHPSSLINILNASRRSSRTVLESTSSPESDDIDKRLPDARAIEKVSTSSRWGTLKREKSVSGTLVTIVLVEAKGLPDIPSNGSNHGIYCKIRLGSQSFKSKTIDPKSPQWRERFQISNLYNDDMLKVTLWDKGKQKTFMGTGVLDLHNLEKDRTHEVWLQLDNNYGSLHFSITMCYIRKQETIIEDPITRRINKHDIFTLGNDWNRVGELHVRVIAAKGLSGKPNAFCTLELDNEKVRTHSAGASQEPAWNQNFIFKVQDVTSTLDLKIYDNSIASALLQESLGRVVIPLLRINNGEMKWYALKDKSKRSSAKGNCPRVLLKMSLYWNPIKASLRLFRPKEAKYIAKKPQKFNIGLVYRNTEFMRDIFVLLAKLNDNFKTLFEWENREFSIMALSCWMVFWYYFRLWTTPLLLLAPFVYFWINQKNIQETSFLRGSGVKVDEEPEKKLTERIQEMPEVTLTITDNIDYIGSVAERLYNLASFKVPFLSYLTMVLLVMSSIMFYVVPFNYIMMGFGTYKFSRKFINPGRVLNNDLADFLSRIPDTHVLNEWKELNVPEPTPKLSRSERKSAPPTYN